MNRLARTVTHDPASEVCLDGETLDLQQIGAIARRRLRVVLSPNDDVTNRVCASLGLKDTLVAESIPIYGVTTGFGDSAHRQIAPERAHSLQAGLIRMMGCGTGTYAALDEARATMLIRANCLVRGHSAVRPMVITRLLDLLNADVVPAIREQGSVGASGDLVPLSYVAAALQGQRSVFYKNALKPTMEVFASLGIEPLALQSKEGLALLNGTSFMAAIASLAALDACTLALAADVCTAMATEVLHGKDEPFTPFIHDVAKPHPGQIRSAHNVRWMLEGSRLVTRSEQLRAEVGPMTGVGYRELPNRIQDRYSIRCAPQFIGTLWDTLHWVERWLAVEVNSSNDNPLFDTSSGRVFSGGNFAGGHVALAMDALRTAVASVADMLDRQLALVVDEKFSGGLPPNLAMPVPQGHVEEGLRHGFKGAQIACSALVAEALNLCTPVTVFSRSTECHNQDKVSMGTIAARRTRDVVRLVENVVAFHLLALCQAADLRGPALLGKTRMVWERVRAVVPQLHADREMDSELAAVVWLLRNGSLLEGLELDGSPACG